MIWEENVEFIVMLSKELEAEKVIPCLNFKANLTQEVQRVYIHIVFLAQFQRIRNSHSMMILYLAAKLLFFLANVSRHFN